MFFMFKVPLVNQDSQDTLEVLAPKVLQAVRDRPGQWGFQETKDHLVLPDQLGSLVLLDSLAVLEVLAQPESVDSLDYKEPQAQLEPLDFQVILDPQETLVLLVALELQEQQARQDLREQLVHQVHKAVKGQLDCLVRVVV